jgi:type IV pilus assembly protein PilV
MSSFNSIRSARTRVRGFSLIEVMVALFVTAVGLLGIAKIQALAYASTGSASVRSVVALEAAGLAASMHANRLYWTSGNVPATIIISGPNIVVGGNLGTEGLPISTGTVFCNNGSATTPCTLLYCQAGSPNTPCYNPGTTPTGAELLAASDLQTYAASLNTLLNNSIPTTTITCTVGTSTIPVNCKVQVTWNENAVSLSKATAAATTQCTDAATTNCTFLPTLTLYVEP